MRRVLADRLMAGVLAAMVAYVMLLQGLVSAYAQGALAGPQAGSAWVICAPAGDIPGFDDTSGGSPLERAAHECCAALCHAAASHIPILAAADLGPAFIPEHDAPVHFHNGHPTRQPSVLGLVPDARAPPHISI